MNKQVLIIIIVFLFSSCNKEAQNEVASKRTDSLFISKDSTLETIPVETKNEKEIHIYLLDSLLDVNYRKYRNYKGEEKITSVNIIDTKSKKWIFDSDGPQIESYSDIKKIDEENYSVFVYYDVLFSNDTIPQKLKILNYSLILNLAEKTYKFSKDTTFWPSDSPFSMTDIEKTVIEYKEIVSKDYIPCDLNDPKHSKDDQPILSKMFEIQKRLLSSYISGCDSCRTYSNHLFDKFNKGLDGSDSEYAGELGSVFKELGKK